MHTEVFGLAETSKHGSRELEKKSLMRNKVVDKRHWLFIENAQSGI